MIPELDSVRVEAIQTRPRGKLTWSDICNTYSALNGVVKTTEFQVNCAGPLIGVPSDGELSDGTVMAVACPAAKVREETK